MEVTYVLPFFTLQNMPDLGPMGIDLGVTPSASCCPPILPPYPGLQTDIQTASVSIEIQPIEVRDEMEDRRQTDKEKQVSPIYPWDMCRAARETEEQPLKMLSFHEVPNRRNY